MQSVDDLSWGHTRVLARSAVIVVAILWLVPVLDSTWAAWPFHPANIMWRFRAISIMGGTLITQMLAVTGAAVLGGLLGWRWLVRLASLVALGVMVFTIVGLIIHSMDYVQLRATVPEDARDSFAQAMARGTAQLVLGVVASGVLAIGGVRASAAESTTRRGGTKIVVLPGPAE